MLYYLELDFKIIPNMQHNSHTHAKFQVFDEIHYDFIKENTKKAFCDIFTGFHLRNSLSLHSQTYLE